MIDFKDILILLATDESADPARRTASKEYDLWGRGGTCSRTKLGFRPPWAAPDLTAPLKRSLIQRGNAVGNFIH